MRIRSKPNRSRTALTLLSLGTLLLMGGGGTLARAGEGPEDPEYGSTFGRVRYLEGRVTLQRTGDGELTEATVNDPIVPGDRLLTEDGRSEVGLADGSTLWLDQGSRMNVRNLVDIDNRYESTNLFALESGAVRIEAPDSESKNRTFRVDTEAGSVYLLSGGSFRIETDEGVTTVYSFRGVAELSGDDGSVLVRSGERSSVQPGRAPSDARRFNTARLDDFDRFCEGRLEAYLRRDTGETVEPIVEEVPLEVHPYIGELSFYGSWRRIPDYGWVWRPVYYGSWGPYVNGYWTWCPTGWVWISYDPWGWAPYHYGRWDFVADFGWVWIPGRIWGGAWVSFAVGSSHIGWCPLNYYNRPVFQDTTIINVVNVNVTRLQPRGWRFVPVEQFTNPRSPRAGVRVDRLPRGSEVVLTTRLPRFDPREVAGHPERGTRLVEKVRQARVPLPVAVDRDNKPLPFRSVEKNAAVARGRRGTAVLPQERARLPRGRSAGRSDAPAAPPRPAPSRPEPSARPRGRPDGAPQEGVRPGTGSRDVPGGQDRSRGREPAPPRERIVPPARGSAPPRDTPRSGAGGQGRGNDPPKREAPRDNARRPASYPDEAIERLFDGVLGERGRPRVEPPRVPPPAPSPHPQTRPPRAAPPQSHPPAPRPQPKPREGEDKGKGNGKGH
jgi:hypothetical protein